VLPLTGPQAATSRGIVEGAKLALARARGKAGPFEIGFAAIDETRGGAAQAAREAVQDLQTIAVIGAGTEGSGRMAVPLLNAAGVGLVGVGAADETLRADPRVQLSGRQGFVPLVPTYAEQAASIAAQETSRRIAVLRDGSPAGILLADELRRALGDRVVDRPERAEVILLAGNDPETATATLPAAAEEAPRARLMATDALVRVLDPEALPQDLRDRVGGYAVSGSTSIDAAFQERFGRPPGRYAALGYAAMELILSAVRDAGPRANSRQAVIDALLAQTRPRVSLVRETPLSR
jgi:ABC-type branched-subunit amino acid transport system substrate-binding protein